MTRSLFVLTVAVLGLCLVLYDAVGFSRHEWGIFSQGFLSGAVMILLLTQFSWRSKGSES